jgi:hypothetical protein
MYGRRGSGPAASAVAGVSLVVTLIGILVFVIAAVALHAHESGGGPGPCVGGPVMGSTGQSLGNGKFRFPCADGGSTVVHLGH